MDKKILEQLEKDKNGGVQSSLPQQQNLQEKISELDNKISKLIDIYLADTITLEEYQQKKEIFINEKRGLQESLKDFAAGANNWFEPAKDFVTSLNRAEYAIKGRKFRITERISGKDWFELYFKRAPPRFFVGSPL